MVGNKAILPSLSSTVGAVSVSIDGEANVSIPLEDEGEGQVGSPVIQATQMLHLQVKLQQVR